MAAASAVEVDVSVPLPSTPPGAPSVAPRSPLGEGSAPRRSPTPRRLSMGTSSRPRSRSSAGGTPGSAAASAPVVAGGRSPACDPTNVSSWPAAVPAGWCAVCYGEVRKKRVSTAHSKGVRGEGCRRSAAGDGRPLEVHGIDWRAAGLDPFPARSRAPPAVSPSGAAPAPTADAPDPAAIAAEAAAGAGTGGGAASSSSASGSSSGAVGAGLPNLSRPSL